MLLGHGQRATASAGTRPYPAQCNPRFDGILHFPTLCRGDIRLKGDAQDELHIAIAFGGRHVVFLLLLEHVQQILGFGTYLCRASTGAKVVHSHGLFVPYHIRYLEAYFASAGFVRF